MRRAQGKEESDEKGTGKGYRTRVNEQEQGIIAKTQDTRARDWCHDTRGKLTRGNNTERQRNWDTESNGKRRKAQGTEDNEKKDKVHGTQVKG